MHYNVTSDVTFCLEGEYIPQLPILHLKLHLNDFANFWGVHVHNFSSHT